MTEARARDQGEQTALDARCYDKPFLKEVIARVDFVAPIEALQQAIPSHLARVISTAFPIREPSEAVAGQLQWTGQQMLHQETRFKQWNFFGRQRQKNVSIAPQFLYVSYSAYTTYEDLRHEASLLLEEVARAFPETRVSRFGLRYVNHIDLELADPIWGWDAYIAADLLATNAFFRLEDGVTRLFHIAELKYGDLDVKFQFGLPNPDHPAVIRRPLFVLDLDAYVTVAHELRESLGYMDEAHTHIQRLFEASITQTLRERMHVRPAFTVQP